MREELYPEIPEQKMTTSRLDLLKTLCHYRKRYFEEFPECYQARLEEIEHLDYADSHTTKEERETQIKSKIFQLAESRKRDYCVQRLIR